MIRILTAAVALFTAVAATSSRAATTTSSTTSDTTWFDDSLPAGATGTGTNGDGWNWVTKNPAPYSGSKAHQTILYSGAHEHAFDWARTAFLVGTGNTLFAYVYIDPMNPPSEIMLSWAKGTNDWNHRAYWGANKLAYGTDGTASQYYVGALPAAGQWARLEVPASAVGLEGTALQGMSFTLYGGRATFDKAGRGVVTTTSSTGTTSGGTTSGTSTSTTSTSTTSGTTSTSTTSTSTTSTPSTSTTTTSGGTTSGTTTTTTTTTVDTKWFDDALPAGATGIANNGDSWNWVSSSPAPYSGSLAHQSAIVAGAHDHAFAWASTPLAIATGSSLYTYVYLDPANPPSEVMFTWYDGSGWEHRAYWGANALAYGTNGTANQYYVGPLPATGQWVRLQVPAKAVGLEGVSVSGMDFVLYNGRATFDNTGVAATVTTTSGTPSGGTTSSTTTTSTSTAVDTVWVNDALPAGATGIANNGDSWNWVNASPAPFLGGSAHQSALVSGAHDHAFAWVTTPLTVPTGSKLYSYVYLDPANTPTEVMFTWYDGSGWEHRAYWGANALAYGTNGTANQYYVGPLPAAGQWVRLEVPASAVALEGKSVSGMDYILYNGRATFDDSGLSTGTTATTSGTTSGGTTSGTTTTTTATTSGTTSGTTSTPTTTTSGTTSGSTSSGTTTTTTTTTSGTTSGGTTSGTSTSTTSTSSTASTSTTTTSGTTSSGTTSGTTTTATTTTVDNAWVDDALPAGASGFGNNGDAWNWVSSPTQHGTMAHQSALLAGEHDHIFGWATIPLNVNTGAKLYTYVYLDPANPPTEVMLGWFDGSSWEHRAYWGANSIAYGTAGTVSQYHAGPLPATGQWVRLEVPASAVGLEGAALTGMDFMLYNGRATFDNAGVTKIAPVSTSNGDLTSTAPTGTTLLRPIQVGDYQMRVISPTVIEINHVTTKAADPATVTEWNFVDSSGNYTAPATSKFAVTVNGTSVPVSSVGFRRRVGYGDFSVYDLRIDNSLFLTLNAPISDGQTVKVANPDASLWPSTIQFALAAAPLRYSPAIHVNQEGYVPSLPKKAMVGYNLGNQGELPVSATTFSIVSAATGVAVYNGTLSTRADVGWTYSPTPYQKVLQADFSSVTTPGSYQLVVPGLGASLPFVIDDGIAMDFTRTYALGMYHQRCGFAEALPFTRFTHAACHTGAAQVPTTDSAYNFTWSCIASKSGGNTTQTAPQLTSAATQLYPFVNQGTVDVSGGHHDAGDYSKYTIDVAEMVHRLMFTVDAIPGAAALDNLGLPESGDGISDIMQEAKWEADYLAKLQDADGGFYFIVYPKNREYEYDVSPENGDSQVVWPKNTACTAAAVAALAECASSPAFKATYPTVAANYLAKAKLGWQFLLNAQAKYGVTGAYQKITFYGDDFNDADELAWAACELFLATGDSQYSQKLYQWFPNPADTATMRWGWVRLSESYGCAIRDYAFAVKTGRLTATQLDANYLAACQNQVTLAGDDALTWTTQSAYGTAFPSNTKAVMSSGWYFSLDQASAMAAAYQLNAKAAYIDALVSNMNYEAGSNPVNMSYLAGIGQRRERHMVSQYSLNNRHLMPPDGEPAGNIMSSYGWMQLYGNELTNLSFPSDTASSAAYPFYDRYTDIWNVTTEFVTDNQSRAIMSAAFLATQTASKSVAWKPTATVPIAVPTTTVPVAAPVTLSLNTTGLNLTNARILWEARDQQPVFGTTFTLTPLNSGTQWVEVEISWPDGRRMFGTASFSAQ